MPQLVPERFAVYAKLLYGSHDDSWLYATRTLWVIGSKQIVASPTPILMDHQAAVDICTLVATRDPGVVTLIHELRPLQSQ